VILIHLIGQSLATQIFLTLKHFKQLLPINNFMIKTFSNSHLLISFVLMRNLNLN
ncbi:hypothetical protein TVAGG3_0621210, partial [Trichomonas vaginalis G3]|uniref:hypothetical protein n=1 Tax=Trichomonas vaginalis (strain ATCC PRA-98 / G3) TaxID=412133 RepID=UPI0021E5A63C